jgi:hypothetical protein
MVRPFEGSNFSLGAVIYNSNLSNIRSEIAFNDQDGASYEDYADILQHTAYGTIFGYTYSTDNFLGLQAWGGGGYLTNFIEVESDMTGILKPETNPKGVTIPLKKSRWMPPSASSASESTTAFKKIYP